MQEKNDTIISGKFKSKAKNKNCTYVVTNSVTNVLPWTHNNYSPDQLIYLSWHLDYITVTTKAYHSTIIMEQVCTEEYVLTTCFSKIHFNIIPYLLQSLSGQTTL